MNNCPDCGLNGTLEWHCNQQSMSCAADGRLTLLDIDTVFSLGCQHCYAQIKTMTGDKVAALLTDNTINMQVTT
jgi:hypothetical protein